MFYSETASLSLIKKATIGNDKSATILMPLQTFPLLFSSIPRFSATSCSGIGKFSCLPFEKSQCATPSLTHH